MSENPNVASPAPSSPEVASPTASPEPANNAPPATGSDNADWPVLEEAAPSSAASTTSTATAPPGMEQSSMAAPRGLSYAVDIVFCIDVTGSMTPIIDQVKANALRFYDDVQSNLTAKGKNVDQLRVKVIAFRDFVADGAAALDESPFFTLPGERASFSDFVSGLIAEGGGDAPESGLEAVALAIDSPWTYDWRSPPASHCGVDRPACAAARRFRAACRSVLSGAGRLQRPDRCVGRRTGPDGVQFEAAHPLRAGWAGLERHLRGVGERGA